MRVLIVGGGLAGLFNGYSLSQKKHDIVILEKTAHLGGELRTINYNLNGETFFFDLGPHIPPKNHEIWNKLCKKVDTTYVPLPITSCLKLNKVDLIHPLGVNNIHFPEILYLLKFGPSFLRSALHMKKEENLEDSLINLWGGAFYKTYLKDYISNFWKAHPKNISKSYKARFAPPKIKTVIQSFRKSLSQPNIRLSNSPEKSFLNMKSVINDIKNHFLKKSYPYPKYGIEGVLDPLINEMNKKGVQIKKNSIIKKLTFQNNSIFVEIKDSNKHYKDKFDKLIWTAPIPDLIHLLELPQYDLFSYRHLLTINCAIFKENILGAKVHTSYIMIPNIIFHRVYEPNKLSPFMSPKLTTSVCIEITLEKKPQNLQLLIKTCLKQFQQIFSLQESQIKYLGFYFVENAYPLLFINFQNHFNRFLMILNKKSKNISLVGRLGQFFPYTIDETLNSVLSSQ